MMNSAGGGGNYSTDQELQECHELVSRSSFVLSQCSVVQQLLDKLYKNVKTNAAEVETCAKSIVHHLEFKI